MGKREREEVKSKRERARERGSKQIKKERKGDEMIL